jgi:branched-chain amino acid aminotransferase
VLYTPQLGSILPGITRATVLEICNELGLEVVEKQLTLEDVHGKDGAFFCGTGAEIVGIESLDSIEFKKPFKETIGAVIQKAYKNIVLETELVTADTIA